MSETKHTRGPWRADRNRGCKSIFGARRSPHAPEPDIAFTTGLANEKADRANARLIAACPTMYAYIAKKAQDGDADAARILAAL